MQRNIFTRQVVDEPVIEHYLHSLAASRVIALGMA
jgi:hypothetical protein